MNEFYVWFAESKTASYLRALVVIVLYQAISDFQRTGGFDVTNWKNWVITGLVSFLPMLSRVKNPEDSLS